ncbi:MFS transporter [Nocardioides sp. SYSU D00065]|uniref:MFS transporter n=1 Tax=Nocardioides sp. SYSU D00065 TaxID=2817378 RepID=UPI001B33E9B9|nr:MFS transporter [Nocardioides sp. SYSU D00065]
MRPAIIFLTADVVSLFGNAIAAIAFPWLVFTVTGSAGQAGVVATSAAVPALLATIVGGHVIDRLGRRRIAVGADVLSAVSLAALPIVDAAVGLDLAWLVALAVLGAVVDGPGVTARDTMLHDVATASGWSLERFAGAREAIAGTAILVGPGLAGVLLATMTTSTVLWVSAAASLLAAVLTALTPSAPPRDDARTDTSVADDATGLLQSVPEGIRALWRDRVVWTLTLLGAGTAAVIGPIQSLVLPGIFTAWDSPASLGVATSALAAGSVLGALTFAGLRARLSRRAFVVAGLTVTTGGFAVLATLAGSAVVIAAMATVGFGTGLTAPLLPVLMAERIPDEFRGRVFAWQNAAALAALPVGLLITGAVADTTSLGTAAIALACSWAVVALVGLRLCIEQSLDAPASASRTDSAVSPGTSTDPQPEEDVRPSR